MPKYDREVNEVHGFVKDELDTVRQVVERTWDAVASDMFINEDGEFDPSMTFSRADVVEVSLDADRWRDYCSKEAEFEKTLNKLFALKQPAFTEVITEAIPSELFGY